MKIKSIIIPLFVVVAITLCKPALAQQTEGMVKYESTFDWVKILKACPYLDQKQQERNAYIWGNRSEWKMLNLLYFSPDQSKFEDSEEKAKDDDYGYNERKEVFFRIRNFKNSTQTDAFDFLGKKYIVKDSLQTPDWKILNDIKEVAGHVCMNATYYDSLRFQKIVAWFALDIPIKAGPDRFFGLPGLILEVNINNGAKTIIAQNIDFKPITTEFTIPEKLKGKTIRDSEFTEILKKYFDDKRQAEEFPWGARY